MLCTDARLYDHSHVFLLYYAGQHESFETPASTFCTGAKLYGHSRVSFDNITSIFCTAARRQDLSKTFRTSSPCYFAAPRETFEGLGSILSTGARLLGFWVLELS
jgi:hypothetical protein